MPSPLAGCAPKSHPAFFVAKSWLSFSMLGLCTRAMDFYVNVAWRALSLARERGRWHPDVLPYAKYLRFAICPQIIKYFKISFRPSYRNVLRCNPLVTPTAKPTHQLNPSASGVLLAGNFPAFTSTARIRFNGVYCAERFSSV